MNRADIIKKIGIDQKRADDLKKLNSASKRINQSKTDEIGMALVTSSTSFGAGSIVSLSVLSNGIGSGVQYKNAKSYVPVAVGDTVSFKINNGVVEILSGGSTINISNANSLTAQVGIHSHQGYYSGGWAGFLSGGL